LPLAGSDLKGAFTAPFLWALQVGGRSWKCCDTQSTLIALACSPYVHLHLARRWWCRQSDCADWPVAVAWRASRGAGRADGRR